MSDEFAPDADDQDYSDLVVDFTDVQGGTFAAIPAGKYPAVLTDWSMTATKNPGKIPAGTPGINWEFTIDEDHPTAGNRKQWTNHWIHPNTLGFLKDLFSECGIPEDEINELRTVADIQAMADRVVGTEVDIVVKVRPYNGEDRNDIKKVKARGASSSSAGGGSSLLP